jgi:hypothetical protein
VGEKDFPDTELLTFSVAEGFGVVARDGTHGQLAGALLRLEPKVVDCDAVAFEGADGRCLVIAGGGWFPPLEILVETPDDIPAVVVAVDEYLDCHEGDQQGRG